MDWTKILKDGGVPESPGYQETLADMRANPKPNKKAPARGRGNKGRGSLFPSAKHGTD